MARRPREDWPGSEHHVVNRGIAKRPYFETRDDQRYFLAQVAAQVRVGRIEVLAYSLLTTHFHLYLHSPIGELSIAMKLVQNAYSRRFNRLRKRDGPLIRARFWSKRVETDAYRRALVRYIDDNPVRAGIVRRSAEHEFGSARAFHGRRRPPWLRCERVEQLARQFAGATQYSGSLYLSVFGPQATGDPDALREVVEGRLQSAGTIDPLEDLVGSTPREVREWMQRKAMLADGMPVGLAVCGVSSLRRVIDRNVARHGEWLVDDRDRTWRGSGLAWTALLRTTCAQPWRRIAELTGKTISKVRTAEEVSRRAMQHDQRHAARVLEIAVEATDGTLGLIR